MSPDSGISIAASLLAGRPGEPGSIAGRWKFVVSSKLWDASSLLLYGHQDFLLGVKAAGAWRFSLAVQCGV